MARIRTIKPEFPHSESMGRVSREARLLFIQLWTIADDSGRLRGNSRILASLLYPYDDDAKDLIDSWLCELDREGCVARYVVDGSTYLQVLHWAEHQKIDKPSASKLPEFEESSRIVAKPREDSRSLIGPGPGIDQEGTGPTTAAAAPVVQTQRDEFDQRFDEFKSLYPKRSGDQRWPTAAKHIRARLREGSTWNEILDGVRRYAEWVRAAGKEGTELVKQAATFVGPDKGFREAFEIPRVSNGTTGGSGKQIVSALDIVRRATGVRL